MFWCCALLMLSPYIVELFGRAIVMVISCGSY
uniref:Uncharacterized protein n=1 Tax=Rhizophora mucronata TaxID=61149 RepID=A0A2P2NE59_RHIMU